MRRVPIFSGMPAILVSIALAGCGQDQPHPQAPYSPPPGATVSLFPGQRLPARILTIAAATDVSFSRPLILDYQRDHPDMTIRYVDMISSALFEHAEQACRGGQTTADLYISVATNTLVRLANDGCARRMPDAAAPAPQTAQWRRSVVAFAVERAVFVYNRDRISDSDVPRDHLHLIATLRADPSHWFGRVGTYDIATSEIGYAYANEDARHSAIYGRLIESFGRSAVREYCCSNEMASAVAKGDIDFAYNVQMSYAAAARRQHSNLGVIVPSDYQAVQWRSVMIPTGARDPQAAEEFAAYLLSPRGQGVLRAQRAASASAAGEAIALADAPPSAPQIGPALLAQSDAARRRTFLAEWISAVRSPR